MKTKDKVKKSLSIDPKNTGSSEAQIGFLTEKIKDLSEHFKSHKKDRHSSLGLLKSIFL